MSTENSAFDGVTNLVRFTENVSGWSRTSIGTVVEECVVDLIASYRAYIGRNRSAAATTAALPDDMREFIEGGEPMLLAADEALKHHTVSDRYAMADVELLTPIPNPVSIFMLGRVYAKHAKISGHEVSDRPVLFMKSRNCLIGPDQGIELPRGRGPFRFGTELCVVFGKAGKVVLDGSPMDSVYGYTIINDIASGAEEHQRHTMFDTFAPVGPCIVPKRSLPAPDRLILKTVVDRQIVQNGSVSEATWTVEELVADVLSDVSVNVGDLLGLGDTGTTGHLTHGQIVESSIDGIGMLRNFTIEENRNGSPE